MRRSVARSFSRARLLMTSGRFFLLEIGTKLTAYRQQLRQLLNAHRIIIMDGGDHVAPFFPDDAKMRKFPHRNEFPRFHTALSFRIAYYNRCFRDSFMLSEQLL